jgi:phosphoribosylamine--glycine ligase
VNILIIGSGGREHAFAWKLKQSPKLEKLFIAPGNAGTASLGSNLDIEVTDFEKLAAAVIENRIDMIIVGPEVPLVAGIHDYFASIPELKNIPVIGPDKSGARLEGSKDFAKEFMVKYNIPTAGYLSVTQQNLDEGIAFLGKLNAPYVLKADGLAAGKGVLIIESRSEAEEALREMIGGMFGEASATVVIEAFLSGIECSVFVLTDGKNYKILPEAKDYKRIGEGDTGLNTGGMGAISPVPFADATFMKKVEERIVQPTIDGLRSENIDYRGFVFIGLMNCGGEPMVIEYNVRMGDPETEAVMLRIENDLVGLFEGVAHRTLSEQELKVSNNAAVTVMLVAGGYPGKYDKGLAISVTGSTEESIIFHAGTKLSGTKVVTNGGRVLAVSSTGKDFKDALEKSYRSAAKVKFDKMYYRRDLGFDL